MAPRLRGVDARAVRRERYEATTGRVLLTGVQALARAPIDQRRLDDAAGLSAAGFISGYPGSPLAGFDLELERMADLLARYDIVHSPGLNEELAATAVAGSQLALLQSDRRVDALSSLWYAKSPGLDRASDAMRHGNLMGTGPSGGVLVAVGDDPQAKSSSVPSTSEPTLYALGLPILSPADPQDVLDFALHGYAMSRASGLWVGLRIPASVADATQSVTVDPGRLDLREPSRAFGEESFRHRVTAQLLGATLLELEATLYGRRLEMARRYSALNQLDVVSARGESDSVGIIAAGPAYLSVVHALRALGLSLEDLAGAGVRLLKIAVLYPLNEELVRDFARGLREVVVVEDKRGFLENLVRVALYGLSDAPRVVGKFDDAGPLVASTSEVDPDSLASALGRRLARLAPPVAPVLAPLSLVRGAYFCAGCPHNSSVKLPEGSCVGSGSGCHGLILQMAPRQVGTVVGRFQMGGEGAMWNGMSHFVAAEHFFQNIGDGTFAHSGSLAVRAAIAEGVNITFKLLVNSSVAMTGGQKVLGPRGVGDLCRLLEAEGVARIVLTSDDPRRASYAELPEGVEVRDRREILEVERELSATPGVTVLLHDQECAIQRRRRERHDHTRRRRVVINPLVCDGCGECGARTNCLALRPVQTPWGPKTEVHQETCALDYSCLDSPCPAFVTVETAGDSAPELGAIAPSRLVDPPVRVGGESFSVRLAGVGGTGVVTVAQIIAWAAHLEGRFVRAMDQTGIAQKGGSVISDVRVSSGEEVAPFKLAAGEADLYLGLEMLVASEPRALVAVTPERTLAVVSSTRVPTGRQVANSSLASPSLSEVTERIDARSHDVLWLDASALSRRLLGADVYANVLLLGAAFQRGGLGLSHEAIERAIELNGVAVAENLHAFRLGRLYVIEPEASEFAAPSLPSRRRPLADELVARAGLDVHGALGEATAERASDLLDYQDEAYARRYVALVGAVRAAEFERCGVADGPLTTAVATQFHRLMAYRDEYEVARLLLDEGFVQGVHAQFAEAKIHFQLHPATLRRLGRSKKMSLGEGAVALKVLAGRRGLRGGALDPFGHDDVRVAERFVRDEYEETMSRLCEDVSPENYALVRELAELVDTIRGYGDVKLARVRDYAPRRAALLSQITSLAPSR
jgi:indolepyruvate ferredoxin oxidoreductase